MLKIADIRNNKKKIAQALNKRGFMETDILDKVVQLDDVKKEKKQNLERLQEESNILAKNIGDLFREGNQEKGNQKKKKALLLKDKIKDVNKEVKQIEEELISLLIQIPNVPNKLVPVGRTSVDNEVIKEKKIKLNLPQKPYPHWDLSNKFGLIDFELGNKITGSGFPVYIGKGARLQRALINFFLKKNIDAGYTEYSPPYLVNQKSGFGTGQLPDKEGQMYNVKSDNLFLIPTSEVPITNMFRNMLLNINDLPIKCTAYSPCFRREAGSYGKDVRGLNRLHQFDKVEIVEIQNPKESYKALEEMVKHIESILIDLQLPYRIVKLCGGDLGFTSSLTYDFEVYSAAQEKWLEVSSVSNFESFQANRLKLRFKNKQKIELCHTLNGSSLALPRIVAALLENNQSKNKIKLPEVLIPYTGFEYID